MTIKIKYGPVIQSGIKGQYLLVKVINRIITSPGDITHSHIQSNACIKI